jgi:hypothetical protein
MLLPTTLFCCIGFFRANLTYAKNNFLSFRLTVILHQKRTGRNHTEEQVNASVKAAFVHALGDIFQSISVLISALIIYFKVSEFEFVYHHHNCMH